MRGREAPPGSESTGHAGRVRTWDRKLLPHGSAARVKAFAAAGTYGARAAAGRTAVSTRAAPGGVWDERLPLTHHHGARLPCTMLIPRFSPISPTDLQTRTRGVARWAARTRPIPRC